MKFFENMSFDEERALYGSDGVGVRNCRFDGERDGESAFKESKDVKAENSYFYLSDFCSKFSSGGNLEY